MQGVDLREGLMIATLSAGQNLFANLFGGE
jgi:hypothetical protein